MKYNSINPSDLLNIARNLNPPEIQWASFILLKTLSNFFSPSIEVLQNPFNPTCLHPQLQLYTFFVSHIVVDKTMPQANALLIEPVRVYREGRHLTH